MGDEKDLKRLQQFFFCLSNLKVFTICNIMKESCQFDDLMIEWRLEEEQVEEEAVKEGEDGR
jgi:hypothetical protein